MKKQTRIYYELLSQICALDFALIRAGLTSAKKLKKWKRRFHAALLKRDFPSKKGSR